MSVRSLNRVFLIGNLTRDPEIRYTGNGTPVATFGLATNKSWKNADGEVQELTEYHNIVAWNKMAEICHKILAKGMKVFIEGSITTRSWEDDTGTTKYKTEIRVEDMFLLDSKGRAGAGSTSEGAGAPDVVADAGKFEEVLDDDIGGLPQRKADGTPERVEGSPQAPSKSKKEAKKDESESEDDLPF